MRDKIWFHHTLQLRYETASDQLRYILAEIRKMLYGHPKVESASARVRFIGFGNSSLDLEVFAYVLETDYGIFPSIQEDLLLRIMEIVEASGSGFAFPSQITYLATDAGIDAEKSAASHPEGPRMAGKRRIALSGFLARNHCQNRQPTRIPSAGLGPGE